MERFLCLFLYLLSKKLLGKHKHDNVQLTEKLFFHEHLLLDLNGQDKALQFFPIRKLKNYNNKK